MPGGRREYIPTHCRDAKGRKLSLFNPAMRANEPPAGTDFTLAEWQSLLDSLRVSKLHRQPWLRLIAPCLVGFGVPIWLLISSGVPFWQAVPFTLLPLIVMLLVLGGLKGILARTWGVLAFVNIPERDVLREMLKSGRCPSCAYRLPSAGLDGRATCSECGGVWRATSRRAEQGQASAV
ncbi:MAG: hypothetical protein QM783_11545 [Phycisphaerales bacterium]